MTLNPPGKIEVIFPRRGFVRCKILKHCWNEIVSNEVDSWFLFSFPWDQCCRCGLVTTGQRLDPIRQQGARPSDSLCCCSRISFAGWVFFLLGNFRPLVTQMRERDTTTSATGPELVTFQNQTAFVSHTPTDKAVSGRKTEKVTRIQEWGQIKMKFSSLGNFVPL